MTDTGILNVVADGTADTTCAPFRAGVAPVWLAMTTTEPTDNRCDVDVVMRVGSATDDEVMVFAAGAVTIVSTNGPTETDNVILASNDPLAVPPGPAQPPTLTAPERLT